MAISLVKRDLVVSWLYIPFVGKNPYLEEFHITIFILVVFTVCDPWAGAHHLDVTIPDHRNIAHAVFVFQVALQRDRDDFHIIMGMCAKAFGRSYLIVVEDAENAEMHAFGIVVVGKTEGMATVKPPMIGITARVGFMKNCIFHDNWICVREVIKPNDLQWA